MMRDLGVLIIAAGGVNRPRPGKPTAFSSIMGKPLLAIVTDTVSSLKPGKVVVAAAGSLKDIRDILNRRDIRIVAVNDEAGITETVLAARKAFSLDTDRDLLIVNGDLPLLTARTLRALLKQHRKEGDFLTFLHDELRRDAGVCVCRTRELFQALPRIVPSRKEVFPLVGLIEAMFLAGKRIGAFEAPDPREIFRVAVPSDLGRIAAVLRMKKIRDLAEKGIIVWDPLSTWIDLDVEIEKGTVLYPSVIIEGKSRVGSDCRILPFSHIINTKIGNRAIVRGSTVIEESVLEDEVQVGPFAHIRPKTVIRKGAHVGNFVEMKKTDFGPGSKAGHLSYLGDSWVGEGANIGAGTITCNYDGVKKNPTWIGAGAFIGSGTMLVAPVKVGKGAYIGAGSTITKDVSADALAIARGRQFERPGWAKRRRKG
jgi:bifunctional UDP-N-acetylglucosamine pyrophosphorylase/glucosamine-1-phosphate N-acetyltransferase